MFLLISPDVYLYIHIQPEKEKDPHASKFEDLTK